MARRLLLLNGLAVLGVVMNHATGTGFTAMFWWADRYLPVSAPDFGQMYGLPYFVLRVIEQAVAFTVPAFLFVSGFFIAFVTGRNLKTDASRIIRTRVVALAIPFIVWSALILFGRFLEGERFSGQRIIEMIAFGRAAPPYYYIPVLIQLYLLSPLFVAAARRRWRPTLLGVALVSLSIQCLHYFYVLDIGGPVVGTLVALVPIWLFPAKAFWFVLGIVACLHLHEFRNWLTRTRGWWLAALPALMILGMLEWEMLLPMSGKPWIPYYDTAFDSVYALAFILCFLAYEEASWPLAEQLATLGSSSYAVYLIHAPAQAYAARAVAVLAPGLLAYQILLQPFLWVIGLGVPLLLIALVKRTPARRYSEVLFG